MTTTLQARHSRHRRLVTVAVIGLTATALSITAGPRRATSAAAIPPPFLAPTSVIITGNSVHASQLRSDMPAALRDGSTRVTAVSAGYFHAMALTADGTVYDWYIDGNPLVVPPAPSGSYDAISAGANFGLAHTTTGQIVGWGNNSSGQLNFPPAPTGSFTQISAGFVSSAALTSSGAVVAVGNNTHGQLNLSCSACTAVATDTWRDETRGFTSAVRAASVHRGLYQDEIITTAGNQPTGRPAPYAAVDFGGQVPPPAYNQYPHLSAPGEKIVALSSGGAHTLGLSNFGRVYAWGGDTYGQSGVPPALTSVAAIAAGEFNSAALRTDGSVIGWGRDVFSELDFPPGRYSGIALSWDFGMAIVSPALAPHLVSQPVAKTVTAGSTVSFTASAYGNYDPTAQWQRCTRLGTICTDIPGATWHSTLGDTTTTTTYTLPATIDQNNTSYRAVFTNSLGTATTTPATLTITQAPLITAQPQSQTVTPLTTVTATATATANPAPTAHWDTCASNNPLTCNPLTTDTTPTYGPGGATITLTLNPCHYPLPRYYRAVFTNTLATTATITVTTQ